MALRSLGSTLLAKTTPGSQLRTTEEKRTSGAVQSGAEGGQPTSVSRENIEQPLETPTPEGSQKNVATKPNIQEKVSIDRSQSPLLAGIIGMPVPGTKVGTPSVSPGMAARPIAAGGVSAPRSEVAATPISGGASLLTQINKADPTGMLSKAQKTGYAKQGSNVGTPVSVATNKPTAIPFSIPSIAALGNRASAFSPGDNSFTRNLLQGVSATVESLINKIGEATGNVAPEMRVSEKLGMFANNPNSQAGISQNVNKLNDMVRETAGTSSAPIPKAVNKIVTQPKKAASIIRETFKPANTQAMASNLRSAASSALNKVGSFIRSLFR